MLIFFPAHPSLVSSLECGGDFFPPPSSPRLREDEGGGKKNISHRQREQENYIEKEKSKGFYKGGKELARKQEAL